LLFQLFDEGSATDYQPRRGIGQAGAGVIRPLSDGVTPS
jgi:hypothetical protein